MNMIDIETAETRRAVQRQPQEMGDFRLQKTGDGWELYIGERRVMTGLAFAQALQVIRGEFDVSALRRGELVQHGD